MVSTPRRGGPCSEAFQQCIVLSVRSDPEPHPGILPLHRQSPPTEGDPNGENGLREMDLLELQPGMAGIFPKPGEGRLGSLLNLRGESVIRLPKSGSSPRPQPSSKSRDLVRPCSSSEVASEANDSSRCWLPAKLHPNDLQIRFRPRPWPRPRPVARQAIPRRAALPLGGAPSSFVFSLLEPRDDTQPSSTRSMMGVTSSDG